MPALPMDDSLLRIPQSVEQITKRAQDYDYNALTPLKFWLRSANTMLKQADQYEREGLDEETYFLLFRHSHLVLSNIVVHPDAKHAINKAAVHDACDAVTKNLRRMEVLKPRIKKRYERYQQIQQEREANKAATATAGDARQSHFYNLQFDDHKQTLDPRDHGELAARLAQREAQRRAAGRMPDQYPREGETHPMAVQASYRQNGRPYQEDDIKDDLSRRLQEVRGRIERPHASYGSQSGQGYGDLRSSTYSYPTVPSKSELSESWRDLGSPSTGTSTTHTPPPIPPPKELATSNHHSLQHAPPSIPSKTPLDAPTIPPKTAPTTPPQDIHFRTLATTESGAPLRSVFLPPTLRHRFLQIALPNTRRNLETCGILAGHLKSNALFISHLIIPSQHSTTDTCEMEDESTLFDYVDEENLMVLGWIHTHPTQTCFMSSRDLHTQSGYQVMLPESIAIVCAPSQHTQREHRNGGHRSNDGDEYNDEDGDWGCFRLTDPPGLKSILGCTKEGLFHPHEVNDIYTGALRPGHVVEAKGMGLAIVDLRGKK